MHFTFLAHLFYHTFCFSAKKGRDSNTSSSKPRRPQQHDNDDDDFFKQLLRSVGFAFKNGSVAMDEGYLLFHYSTGSSL